MPGLIRAGVALGLGWSAVFSTAWAEPIAQPKEQQASLPAGTPVIMSASGVNISSFAEIVKRVSPAVVSLAAGSSQGSGFVIDASGYIVTNNHVLGGKNEADIRFANGTKYKSRLIGRDEATDIALLKIDAGRTFPSVKFGDDKTAQVGDWVLAVGNPLGLGGTVTAGILSARGRDQFPGAQNLTDYLQVDAAINPGNSGGPTFDMSGRVIGMNTLAIASPWGGVATGIGFAIPSSTIQRVVKDLKEGGVVVRGFLGVQLESLTDDVAKALGLPNANGALVTDVIEGSPAQKAGIKRGDVIIKINGQPVKDSRELSRKIAALQVGQSATFTIWRDNSQIAVTVTVAKRELLSEVQGGGLGPDGEAKAEVKLTSLGLGLQSITEAVRSEFKLAQGAAGVLITNVEFASDAAERGLRPGDRIVAVGNDDVKSLGDVNLAIEEAKALKRPAVLLFVVTQRGAKAHVTIKLNTN